MSYYAEQIADWAISLDFEDIPQDVIDTGKHCLSDWTGIAIYGSLSPWSEAAASVVKEEGGKAESTLLADGIKVPAPRAALVNGIRALSYDMSDTFMETALHPSCGVISAALAVAEREKVNGKALITAIIAGYEVSSRVARALNRPPARLISRKGFESNALIPAFGATVAAGKLLGLNQEQMTNAIGLCSCSVTGGLIEYLLDGNWTYRWNGGRAGHDGVLNALMTRNGFIGPQAVFEGQWDDQGRYGLVNAFTGSIETAPEVIKDLGKTWHMRKLGFKYYACCHYIQGYIDGILKLMKQERITPDQIEDITCFLSHMTLFLAVPRRIKYEPANLTIAQWSLPFCLALSLIDGHLLHPADQLSPDRLKDPGILALSHRIKGVLNDDLDKIIEEKGILQSPFQLTLTNGKRYQGDSSCKGFPDNPLTEDEAHFKFNALVSRILGGDKMENLYSLLSGIEELRDTSALVYHMCR